MSRLFKLISYVFVFVLCVSCLQEERSPEEVLVPTPAQVECSDASLLLTSKVPKKSEKLVEECGFYYSTDRSMAHAVRVEALMEANSFAVELPEREYGTTYYICSYVTNGHGSEIRSEVVTYNLKALERYVEFGTLKLQLYSKEEKTADVSCEVEVWSGVSISEIGVCFGVTTSPSTEGKHVKGKLTDDGLVLASLQNFLPEKEYYLRAYVRDGEYTAYSEIVPITIELFPPTLASVIVSSITSTSVKFSSAVADNGGDKVTEVGFYYSTDEAVDPDASFRVNQAYSSDSFSLEATNLQANTKYYVKSFAKNSVGVAYSEVASFTTAPAAPLVATLEATEVTESSAVLSGNVISDNGAKITERGFVWLKGMDVPTVESNKLKAEGTTGEFTAVLSDVEPNQKYSFRAYAINSEGTSYGDVMTFSTAVAMPVLAAVEVSNVTSTSATFSSKVLDHGGSTVTDVGFYYSVHPEVDPSASTEVARKYSNDSFSVDVSELQICTKYYIKAFTINAAGTTYSEVISFTTDASTPVVNTVGSSDVTSESVKLSGTVVTDNGATISERGFVWLLGDGSPTLSDNKVVVDGTTGDFTASLTELSPNQKFSFRAYATNAKGTTYGAVMIFSTVKGIPSVSAATVSNITSTSAKFSGKVESHGGETVSDVGFYYSTDPAVAEDNSIKVELKYTNDEFSVNVSDLAIFTKYYVKTYVKNSVGTSYGTIVNFTTESSTPIVTTVGSSDITSSSANLSGSVVTDNGAPVSERGFVWVKGTDAPTTASSRLTVQGTTGEFSAVLTDLEVNQKYSFRAYAINARGTSYGEVLTFTTIASIPKLSALGVSDITSTSATFTSTVTSHGGETVGVVGFYYSTTSPIDVEAAEIVSMPYVEDRFAMTVEGLSAGTQYYVMAFARNSAGMAVNAEVNFKTVSTPPTVVTGDHSEITSSSAKLSGEVLLDNGEPITERGFVWVKGLGTPTTSSNKVRVEGMTGEYSATVSEFEPNQTYSYRAYATNSKGTAYGEVWNFTTLTALPDVKILGVFEITSTTAEIDAKITYDGGETPSEAGFLYDTSSNFATAQKIMAPAIDGDGSYYYTFAGLKRATQYYVKPYATNSAGTSYGEVENFKTLPELPSITTSEVTNITETSANCGGVIIDDGGEILSKGIVWSRTPNPTIDLATKTEVSGSSSSFTGSITGLRSGLPYYVRAYVTNSIGTVYGEQKQFYAAGEIQAVQLEPANSFIISSPDHYSFNTVKGNSSESVGSVAAAEVLWESFGTDEQPAVGSIISFATYKNGKITFSTSEDYREGNAVIAAKDAYGTILWSWHIWLTDQPQEHIYPNNAGTMMDRNLGATSATPGDVGALGLLYQWGRKDPFLGSSSISSAIQANSTTTWSSDSDRTLEYATANPTTFIMCNSNLDWLDTSDSSLWSSEKTIYDPCPAGWRVPDGGEEGVWSNAGVDESISYDATNKGVSFSISSPSDTWYPASGYLDIDGKGLKYGPGYYWSVTPYNRRAYGLLMTSDGNINTISNIERAQGSSVRCQKEGTGGGAYAEDFSTTGAVDLSSDGTANSYIVSNSGTYSLLPVKGNSLASVGSVSAVSVLWESFGTDEKPSKGSLIPGAKYENGRVYFKTPDSYREGNAVIAAKDASGNILWSWHIWLTDQPEEQIYYNNAGTMMDRNLGATSATSGDVGALGLLYQWGRKDPFLGSSSISSSTEAKSTITWPSPVSSNSSNGTVEYATSHPTTFITYNSSNYDWYYTGSSSVDNTLWQSEKTIYDPCPVGWRVPDGGSEGIWSKAGFSSTTFDDTNRGISFSISSPSTTWYPDSGYRNYAGGALSHVGNDGDYWSVTPNRSSAYTLRFDNTGYVFPSDYYYRAYGFGVRCQKEGTGGGSKYDNDFSTSGAISLSDSGTANSYIVSNTGTYSISTVKGNSSESVGSVASAEVLWESFGTVETPKVGSLISKAIYENGKIYFMTPSEFREGNAVVAAKDASGTILWSWHIWLTDQPQEQVYYNNAGTMMDRNLGATSPIPGDVGALGLLYQWGRKDPFLGSSSISSYVNTKSTITWPSAKAPTSSFGTIEYVTANPTTFIGPGSNTDWYYTGSSSTDNTRWQSDKTIYDPCPVGWRVPDGGVNGVWATTLPLTKEGSGVWLEYIFDISNLGINFSGKLGVDANIWYPAEGRLTQNSSSVWDLGSSGAYWSVTPDYNLAYCLLFYSSGMFNPFSSTSRADGCGVRCQKE